MKIIELLTKLSRENFSFFSKNMKKKKHRTIKEQSFYRNSIKGQFIQLKI